MSHTISQHVAAPLSACSTIMQQANLPASGQCTHASCCMSYRVPVRKVHQLGKLNLHSVDCDPCMTRLLKGVPQANNRKRSKCEGRMLHVCNAQCICNSCAASEQIQSPTATTLNGANYIQHLCDTCSAHTQSEPAPAVCPNASQHCMLVLHACTAFPGV